MTAAPRSSTSSGAWTSARRHCCAGTSTTWTPAAAQDPGRERRDHRTVRPVRTRAPRPRAAGRRLVRWSTPVLVRAPRLASTLLLGTLAVWSVAAVVLSVVLAGLA